MPSDKSSAAVVLTAESGVHVTDGSLAGGSVALQSGVTEGLQKEVVVNVDVFPGIGRKKVTANTGFTRMSAGGSGTVNLNVTVITLVKYDETVTIVLLFFGPACVHKFASFPGMAHGRSDIEG